MDMNEKYVLTITEASKYYSIGIKKLRRLAEENKDTFGFKNGKKYMIIKSKFEEFLVESSEI